MNLKLEQQLIVIFAMSTWHATWLISGVLLIQNVLCMLSMQGLTWKDRCHARITNTVSVHTVSL